MNEDAKTKAIKEIIESITNDVFLNQQEEKDVVSNLEQLWDAALKEDGSLINDINGIAGCVEGESKSHYESALRQIRDLCEKRLRGEKE